MSDDNRAIVVQEESKTVLEAIARAARDPQVDVSKLEKLLDIQERILKDQRAMAYKSSLARLQANLPQIAKSGSILDRDGKARNKYAKIEDIDAVIRPICAEEGFSFAFDSKNVQGGIEYSCAMHHRDGHTETKTITLPIDNGAGRNAVQSVGSTTSYARRYLLGMHLNLVTRDEDDDATRSGETPITSEMAKMLRAQLAEAGGTEERFLKWANASKVEELPAAKFGPALKYIEEKKRQKVGGR